MTIQEKLQNVWENKFDAIYILVYIPYIPVRFGELVKNLERVGLYNAKNLHIVYTGDSSYFTLLYNMLRPTMPESVRNEGIMKASLEHYRVIKNSYDLGYNRICIFEDDIIFLKDLNKVYETLLNLPDYDICFGDSMFGKTYASGRERIKLSKENKINKYWADSSKYNNPVWFASCYMLNRKGMQHIFSSQEKKLCVPDYYTYSGGNLKRAFAIQNICIQNDSEDSLTGSKVFNKRYLKQEIDPSLYGSE